MYQLSLVCLFWASEVAALEVHCKALSFLMNVSLYFTGSHYLKCHMTRNKMRVAIESGKGMKVKVVKLC